MIDAVNVPLSDEPKSKFAKFQPWLVCFSAALFFFFEFIQINMFNALNPSLFRAFHANATDLANLSQNYFYANVLFLFPAGLILDRVSTRLVISLAMFICVCSTLVLSMSTALWQAEICRFVTGIGGAFCLLSSVRLTARWFPPRRMALVVGLIVTFAMTGGMVAQTPFTLLTQWIGWRHTLLFDSFVGFGMLLIIILFVRDYPKADADKIAQQQHHLHEIGFWKAIFATMRNVQNWLAGIYASLINFPIFILGAMWGGMYLVQVMHFDRAQSSYITSMIFLGMIIGSPAFGWFSDRLGRRKSPMIYGAIASTVVIALIMYLPHASLSVMMLLFFVLGFVISSQIISYPLIAESNPQELTGSAEGLGSVLIMAGGFTQDLFAHLMDWSWSGKVVNSVPIYSMHNYRVAMLIMPISFLIALLASFAVKETYVKLYEDAYGKDEVKGASMEESTANV